MFRIEFADDGRILLEGRLDAAQASRAQEFLDHVTEACVLDLADLEYISSAGLGVFLRTHKRLMGSGRSLELTNVNRHINDVFVYSGFDRLFQIRRADEP